MKMLTAQVLPELLRQLHEFDQGLDDHYLDIEFIDRDKKTYSTLIKGREKDFLSFAMDCTGSQIAFWFYENGIPLEEAPIVFLDSEGGGIVVADSPRQFLSLLPYDTSFFSSVAIYWDLYQETPHRVRPPEVRFSQQFYGGLIEDFKESYPNYTLFIDWLENTMGIAKEPDPYTAIITTAQKYPEMSFLDEDRAIKLSTD